MCSLHSYLKRQVMGFLSPLIALLLLRLFLLRPHHSHEEEFRKSNILVNTSLWNVAAIVVNRAASREWVSVQAIVPQIPCGKGLVEFEFYGFLMFIK